MDATHASTVQRILLIEDNEHDVIAFRRSMKKSDVATEIMHYGRAEEALEQIVADPACVDLVVTDYKLPGISGLSLCQEMMKHAVPLPVVLLTGAGSENIAIEALKAGAYDYIIKDHTQRYLELLPVVLVEAIRKHSDRMERKRMGQALLESEKKYRNLFEQANDSIFIIDPSTRRFLDVNENAARRLGYTKAEFLQLTIDDIDTPMAAQRNDAIISELMETGNVTFEHAHLRKDGIVLPIEINAQLIEYGGRQVIQSIVRDITERKQAAEKLQKRTHDLGERVKELNCLYGISHLVEDHGNSLEKILQGTIDLIPPSWQYPEITCASISLNGHEYKTENFKETSWKQTSKIMVKGESIGILEINYLEERAEMDEGPFLNEERSLIDAIASGLGRILERLRAEEKLNREAKLNTALSELYEPLISPTASIEDIAHTVLQKAKSLTASQHGYVSSIDPITGDNIGHTLSEMLKDECTITPENRIAFPIERDGHYKGLWGHALNTLEPFFTNSSQNHPATTGLPGGHIPIQRFLSVPVMLGEGLVGQIALANKKEDYTERDLQTICRVAEFYALAIQRSRVEEALQKANDELEKRVEERTKTLKSTNMKLKDEVEDRKLAEAQLQQSTALLQAVFDGISDPLLMVSKDASVKILNRAALQYYRVEPQNVIGRPCYQAFRGRSDPCEECRIPSLLSNGQQVTFERQGFMDPDLIEQVSIYPLHEKRRERGGAILKIIDITEKKKVERQLIRADRLSSLGQLSGGIAHEIRNPLSGINLYVDILCEAERFKRADQELEIFEEIKLNIKKINGIITRVLDFAKHSDAASGKIEINCLIDEALKLWYTKIRDTKIRLELSLQRDLAPIRGDAIEIQQVVNNLIQNAVEAMPAGGALDIATCNGISSFHQDRPVVLISVGDTGQGIPTEQREKIFDPFFTTKSTGTGLGLSISHQIIERHGGIISFESRSKPATTFSIELPAAAGS